MSADSEAHGTAGGPLLEISNGMVGLHKEAYGRGPSSARTYVVDDICVCVLRGGYTKGEMMLQRGGESETVVDHRLTVQGTIEDAAREIVEEALGRPVLSFMSANDPDHDLQIEFFVLAPRH